LLANLDYPSTCIFSWGFRWQWWGICW